MWLGFSIEFWLTTLVAVALALLTLALTYPRKKRKLSFAIAHTTDLVSDVAPLAPDLQILYRKEAIKNRLYWITGALTNVGSLDVGSSIVAEYPILTLLDNAQWVDLKIGEAAPGIGAESSVLSTLTAEIRWKLLKPNESIPFNALVTTDSTACFSSLCRGQGVGISARIEDTAFVPPKEALASSEEIILVARYKAYSAVSFLCIFLLTAVFSIWLFWLVLTAQRVTFEVTDVPGVFAFSAPQKDEKAITLVSVQGDRTIRVETKQLGLKNLQLAKRPIYPVIPELGLIVAISALSGALCWFRAQAAGRLYRRYRAMKRNASFLELFPFLQKLCGRLRPQQQD